MTDQEQIDALKAQVNCLRKAALDAISFMSGGEAKANLRDAYDMTPEQCLAEVKAQAIEDAILRADDGSGWCYKGDLSRFAKTLREQAK